LRQGTFLTVNSQQFNVYNTESFFLRDFKLFLVYPTYQIVVATAIYLQIFLATTLFRVIIEEWVIILILFTFCLTFLLALSMPIGTVHFTVNNGFRMEKHNDNIILTFGGSYPVTITSPKQPVPLLYPYDDSASRYSPDVGEEQLTYINNHDIESTGLKTPITTTMEMNNIPSLRKEPLFQIKLNPADFQTLEMKTLSEKMVQDNFSFRRRLIVNIQKLVFYKPIYFVMELSNYEIISSQTKKPAIIKNRLNMLGIQKYMDYNELYIQIKDWVTA
jgi:hypothetical protein